MKGPVRLLLTRHFQSALHTRNFSVRRAQKIFHVFSMLNMLYLISCLNKLGYDIPYN